MRSYFPKPLPILFSKTIFWIRTEFTDGFSCLETALAGSVCVCEQTTTEETAPFHVQPYYHQYQLPCESGMVANTELMRPVLISTHLGTETDV